MRRTDLIRPLAVLAIGIGIAAAGDARAQTKLPDFFVDQENLEEGLDPLDGIATTVHRGIHKNAGYWIEVPDYWNGSLVMYAHGFRGGAAALTVSEPRIRRYLVENGFAWAASSYSKNRYDVRAGVQDTMALAQLFNGIVGKPNRRYLIGHSMGGHITGAAIEQFPTAFDGALPMCGVMGDMALFDYFLSFNLVAQAVAGVDAELPPPADWFSTVLPQVLPELGAPYPIALTPAGLALAGATMNLTGGARPVFDIGFLIWNLIPASPDLPGVPFLFQFGDADGTVDGIAVGNVAGNLETVYQIDSDPALSPAEIALNAAVLRVEPDPQGRHAAGLANVPPISGNPPIPVVSLHNLGDLFVPFSMEQIYARRAAANGKADQFVSRAIRAYGHCDFKESEEAAAFADLVDWVENGVKPAGDPILDPAAVADPDFGCQFTLEDRPGIAACP